MTLEARESRRLEPNIFGVGGFVDLNDRVSESEKGLK
jgi:hypothetical protein